MIGLHDALTQPIRVGVFTGTDVSANTHYHVITWYTTNMKNMTAQQTNTNICAIPYLWEGLVHYFPQVVGSPHRAGAFGQLECVEPGVGVEHRISPVAGTEKYTDTMCLHHNLLK